MKFEWSTTDHGFALVKFRDHHNAACSIQGSSLSDVPGIWLGRHVTRMHLTQDMVRALIPLLQDFVGSGVLRVPGAELDYLDWITEVRDELRLTSTLGEGAIAEYTAEGWSDYWADGYSPKEAVEEDMTYWETETDAGNEAPGAHRIDGQTDQGGGAGPQ